MVVVGMGKRVKLLKLARCHVVDQERIRYYRGREHIYCCMPDRQGRCGRDMRIILGYFGLLGGIESSEVLLRR